MKCEVCGKERAKLPIYLIGEKEPVKYTYGGCEDRKDERHKQALLEKIFRRNYE